MKKFSITGLLKIVLPLLLGVYLIWYFFDNMSEKELAGFYKALKNANYFWIFLSLILSFGAFLLRAYRWKYVLEPLGYKTKFWNRYHAMMIGYVVNMTIPRAGEASRALMLQQSDNVPFVKSFGTIITERIVDVLILGCVSLLTFFLVGADFWEIKSEITKQFGNGEDSNSLFSTLKWIVICIALLILLVVSFVKPVRKRIFDFLASLKEGIFSIFSLNSIIQVKSLLVI
jgi:uncharacterized protein (TIRG00374 family)